VDRLVSLTEGRTPQKIKLDAIAELDEDFWFHGSNTHVTCRLIAMHARLIEEADLSHPIIMCSNRRVMDGMHRVLKALSAGLKDIDAVVFESDPDPDYMDVTPDELPH
jgi:hypothetical protein